MLLCYQSYDFHFSNQNEFWRSSHFFVWTLIPSTFIFLLPDFLLLSYFNSILCVNMYVQIYIYEPYYILFGMRSTHTEIHTDIYINVYTSSYIGRKRELGSQEFLWWGLKVKYFFYHLYIYVFYFFLLFRRSWKSALCLLCVCILAFLD